MPKIASWNVNSLKVRSSQVANYLSEKQPDIIGLQELKQTDDTVDTKVFTEMGYHIITYGQKTYNGVALLSRVEPQDVVRGIPNYEDPQARAIAANYGDIRVLNLYVPNGKEVGDEKYLYKLAWFEKLHAYIQELLKNHPKIVITGDFNIAPADIDVHNPKSWQDKILCSKPERATLETIIDYGFTDAFRIQHRETQQFSWWDYRFDGYHRGIGLRIDLTLVSNALTITAAGIDEEPRTWERPSDHTPTWVTISE